MSVSPENRIRIAKVAAEARWAMELDRSRAVRPAVEGRLLKLEAEIDPEGILPAGERRQRAELLRRSRNRAAALKSARVRAERKQRGAA